MDNSSDKFPWPLLLVVIVATLAVTAGVDRYRERKAVEAQQAAAQMAVQVPDHSQTGTPIDAHELTVTKVVPAASPTVEDETDLYAWNDDSFTCEPVESKESWLRETQKRLSEIPGARVDMAFYDQANTFTPRGDGATLMVKTYFRHGLEQCMASASEEKAITESKIAESNAYLAAHANDRTEKLPEPVAIRAPGTLPKEESETLWYLGVDTDGLGFPVPDYRNCAGWPEKLVKRELQFAANAGFIARWVPQFKDSDQVFMIDGVDVKNTYYSEMAAYGLRKETLFSKRSDCLAVLEAFRGN